MISVVICIKKASLLYGQDADHVLPTHPMTSAVEEWRSVCLRDIPKRDSGLSGVHLLSPPSAKRSVHHCRVHADWPR